MVCLLGKVSLIKCVLFVENSTKVGKDGGVYKGGKNFSSFLDELEHLKHF